LWVIALALAPLVEAGAGRALAADGPGIALSDAAQMGAFNVGASRAGVAKVPDPKAEGGGVVLKVDYAMPAGTAAGVWAKGFPATLDADHVDLVRLGARGDDPATLRAIEADLEIKGSRGTKRLPIAGGEAWNLAEVPLDWGAIGNVEEVVVALKPAAGAQAAEGTIYVDVRFEQLPWSRKLAAMPAARIGGALAVAALIAALMLIGQGWRTVPLSGLARDAAQGVGSVLIGLLGLGIFELGGRAEPGWTCLALAAAGAVVAAWWTLALAGRPPSPGEAFRSAAITGLLAASASPMAILQAPGSWPEMLLLSQFVAAVAAVIYHSANARSLAAGGEPLGPVPSWMIAGTPYTFGSLVLLSSPALIGQLGGWLAPGTPWPAGEILARGLVLIGFNVVVAQALALATKRRAIGSVRAHLAFAAVALLAAAGPWIADVGSGPRVASLSGGVRGLAVIAATMASQVGLWAEVYLITGLFLDALRGAAPNGWSSVHYPWQGFAKGAIYSGVFMGLLQGLAALGSIDAVRSIGRAAPWALAVPFGALAFPLVKTIFETFDGSQGFFRRASKSYGDGLLYARGAAVGLGLGLAVSLGMDRREMGARSAFGMLFGVLAFAGVNLARDLVLAARSRGRVQSWRVYLVQGALGGFIGAALGFYFDAVQVEVVARKFARYLAVGSAPEPFGAYPLLSKWGFLDLGTSTGGAKLLYDEALRGVISWSVPAWLFAINRTFLAAYFRKETGPIRALFERGGLLGLTANMIEVLRWGLWMAPIIESFLRPMGEPTWYNQDGAIRTVFALFRDVTTPRDAFQTWSLDVFIALLAYDLVRVLIWLDHMGLRVATLVNLSFLGMDRLDSRMARFTAPASTARCIPESVKRFTTWAPLLIPFYIPQGRNWDVAWDRSQKLQAAGGGGPLAHLLALPTGQQVLLLGGLTLAGTAAFSLGRWLGARRKAAVPASWSLANTEYQVTLKGTGEIVSTIPTRGYDLTRRSYDGLDPAGRALFVLDGDRAWPLVGHFPGVTSAHGKDGEALTIGRSEGSLHARVAITLPGQGDPAELWTITVENRGGESRRVELIPYAEWVLDKPDADRGHTQYNRLFPEMEYASGLHGVLAWDKHAKAMGLLASDLEPEGFLTSRVDFIGRGRSIRSPRILETLAFTGPVDTDSHPTFDPIASLRLAFDLAPGQSKVVRVLIGFADGKPHAIDLIDRHLSIPGARAVLGDRRRKEHHPIGHGEVPPGTPRPYFEYADDGRTLRVLTPFTPRPFDHQMSNALGHVLAVTNRGFQTSSSGNAQQNRLTPDWPDTVTREVPPEAFYLFDPESREWFSPTYHPLNDAEATYETDFGVDGTATFHMSKGSIETELTVFVPPDRPTGVYLLTIRNRGESQRGLYIASYFQVVLAAQPEAAGPLRVRTGGEVAPERPDVTFENPRNQYRPGPAFVHMGGIEPNYGIATTRGQFFGRTGDVTRPEMVWNEDDLVCKGGADDRPAAAIVCHQVIPAGEEFTAVVVLGQADNQAGVRSAIRLCDEGEAAKALASTRAWWLALMDTVRVSTDRADFDRYLDWLKYQALAERIWARRGFYQASGAFGFRDQLQDSVNLIWVDPAIARKQILLHASQQFLEGDVVHWFHRLQDGRTGFAARTHASDNLLWLAWGVVDYVGATGDLSLLDEHTPYLESELPFEPLPAGKAGMGFDPLRSTREDSVYRHCLKAIDLVLDRRMGVHGLPLMGTGDWNDGLDEIGSEGRGESVWLGFFLHYILARMVPIVGRIEGQGRADYYSGRLADLGRALESTWRGDRYLRAFHDDGTEIGVKDSGIWEIDALTAAWAVMSGINPDRGRTVFETALGVLEKETTILLGWPPLREDTKPYLGRSSWYPEGVRENGMYCHGVQWLVGAARILSNRALELGNPDDARHYAEAAYRLWRKISPLDHTAPGSIETYGGQPNKQAADMVTTFDPGRMIWNGYTGAAGWMFRQAIEGVLGLRLVGGTVERTQGAAVAADLGEPRVDRDVSGSPFSKGAEPSSPAREVRPEGATSDLRSAAR